MNFHFCPNDSKNEKDFPFDVKVFFIFLFCFSYKLDNISMKISFLWLICHLKFNQFSPALP